MPCVDELALNNRTLSVTLSSSCYKGLPHIMFCTGGHYDDITWSDVVSLAIDDSFGGSGMEGEVLVYGVYFL